MPLSEAVDRYLQYLYYDLEKPGSFRSPLQLWRQVKKENKHKIGLIKIKQWLQNQDVYSMNKALRRRFKRARVFTGGIRDQYDMDLMDVSFHSKQNDGVKYLFVVIDVFTRYVWISPLQNKTSASVLHALKKCFKVIGPPRKVRSDSGKEFLANQVQSYLKSMDIKHFVTQEESKSNYVERVIKTLRSSMHRYMKRKRSFRYIDSIETIVENFNNTPHSSLGNKAPIEINEDNEVDQTVSQYLTLPVPKKKKKINERKMKKNLPFVLKSGIMSVSLILSTPLNANSWRNILGKFLRSKYVLLNKISLCTN